MDTHYYGDLCSLFYDIDKPAVPQNEYQFFLSYAKETHTILEPMCGSGRFLCEFVKDGYKIDGFDLSADMLKRCKEKLEREKTTANVALSDFRGYTADKRYDLIMIPSGSFSLLIGDEEAHAALIKMKSLLNDGGRIVLVIETAPDGEKGHSGKDEFVFHSDEIAEWKRVKDHNVEVVLQGKSGYNHLKNVVYSPSIYELYIDGEFIRSEHEDFYLKLYKTGEFERLVVNAGFRINNVFADYDKTPYSGQNAEYLIYELSV